MSTRPRSRQTDRPDSDVYDDEFGLVTDGDIDAYLAEQDLEEETETEKASGFLNLQTASGIGLIGLGALYTLQQTGLLGLGQDLTGLITILPVLASILIMLTGFGVLSWSPAARRRRKARERAARMQRDARKTMGRGERRSEFRDAAASAAGAAIGVAGRAIADAGRSATRAAEVAFAQQQAARRREGSRRAGAYRLTKDRRNRKIAGVAAGIANYTGLDPTLVRIAFVAAAIFTNGIAIPLYFLLSFLLPNEPRPERDPFEDDDPFVRVSKD
ncbi:MAG TPA: PspC domain-containing protein [Rubricoccaceae bacterium]|jgi:phage shock protein PspC (stress-responsive transcriptional regulator)